VPFCGGSTSLRRASEKGGVADNGLARFIHRTEPREGYLNILRQRDLTSLSERLVNERFLIIATSPFCPDPLG
jgi:hypothetical protein